MKYLISQHEKQTRKKFLLLFLLGLFVCVPIFAQGGGAITDAANSIKEYWLPLKTLIMMIGGIVGLIGGLRIYNKWTNGDQDINKEILGWGGACLFLILVPVFIGAFFNLNP
ncbi:transposase [Capnocytophaga stomatis]|uniref:DUF4134 family protein n=1 Tax=Capnocytophaga stomatis TaxID=1848904 RepID=UPI00195038EB|nr:DUF4134 family protein [Capnocytophaga stomatis]GIJ95374.1 transposase [Capnocytophaga stomatis]